MKIIARIHNDFKEKFGIPRQSGLSGGLESRIVFEPEYRNPEALRGIEGYSHLWLIWEFSEAKREIWSPTVRPPRLGGNKRVGVFATRSPYRPNPIGLSSVKLERMEQTRDEGTVLIVRGADLLDGTPIYDIKPYLAYSDSHPDAIGGFADPVRNYALKVDFCKELLSKVHISKQKALIEILEQDPRPSYQNDPQREYGMRFADYEIFFKVDGDKLTVVRVEDLEYDT
ncbi:MAG: tRNA (N6-threonylcarbamoyladenosine(37)-N6)-methyltransferase TrmO [Clostridia bacterium]|nr:tRNA (N6-threonylcarbamoyladenosine(37)-N6)-methyltransferase TrmO [Clostridia bacterium]